MINIKLGSVLFSFLLITACGGPNQEKSTNNSTNNAEVQLVNESDSLSTELSSASDSLEKKTKELQETLDNLNN